MFAVESSADILAFLSIKNIAHQLRIIITNSTWRGSFDFPPSDEAKWHLSLDLDDTFLIGSGHGSELLEDFLYTVELDTSLYSSHGSIMFYHRQVRLVDKS